MKSVSISLSCVILDVIFSVFSIFTVCLSVLVGDLYITISNYLDSSISNINPCSLTSSTDPRGVISVAMNIW